MTVIYPLQNRTYDDTSESGEKRSSRYLIKDSNCEKRKSADAIDEFVDFILSKGDEDEISNFKQSLSDFSRYKGHMYDSQLERIDKWQSREKIRNVEMCNAIKDILQKPNLNVLGNYYNFQNNKIEK